MSVIKSLGCITMCALLAVSSISQGQAGSITYEPGHGAGAGKHIVFVCGEWEYRCEESLPMMAKILARRHGFKCSVLFSINPANGTVDPSICTARSSPAWTPLIHPT